MVGGLHVFGGESTTFGRCVMCLTGNTLVHGFAMRHFRHSFSKKSATFLIQINPVSDTMTPVAGCADETRTNNTTNAKILLKQKIHAIFVLLFPRLPPSSMHIRTQKPVVMKFVVLASLAASAAAFAPAKQASASTSALSAFKDELGAQAPVSSSQNDAPRHVDIIV